MEKKVSRLSRMAEYKELIQKMSDFELRQFVMNLIKVEECKQPKFYTRMEKLMWYQMFPPSEFNNN